ncbi:hypothetical protein [Actinophytocola xanthii]|uniref:Uncharacterized protein n=1 Tax=Actinophytocola xanthii TaxID=1912961 RepID=A0A1Q8BTX6_9PSEU|nr:hypothetical protein [Actinophytocola xanthii]OLF05543.1 hypothetical protein BU204_37020 [Actinophytocola xanthii]
MVRLLVRKVLTPPAHDEALIAWVERVAEQLVAHAVATTGVIEEDLPFHAPAFDQLTTLTVYLHDRHDHVSVEVWDTGSTAPDPQLIQALNLGPCEHLHYALTPQLSPRRSRVIWWTAPSEDNALHTELHAEPTELGGWPPADADLDPVAWRTDQHRREKG